MMLGVPIFVSCAIGVALLIASWVADGAKVGVLLIFSSVPLFMLTGLAYPLMAMPKFLQPLARPTNHTRRTNVHSAQSDGRIHSRCLAKDGIFGKCGGALFGVAFLAVKISEQISLNLIEVKI